MTTPSPDDDRPWERPGAVRRDHEPHRGGLLQLLSWASLAAGSVPFVLVILSVMFAGPPPVRFLLRALAGVTVALAMLLAVSTRFIARRDMRKMHAGLMDPAGEEPARAARFVGLLGLALGLLAVAVLGVTFGPDFGFIAVVAGAALLFLLATART